MTQQLGTIMKGNSKWIRKVDLGHYSFVMAISSVDAFLTM